MLRRISTHALHGYSSIATEPQQSWPAPPQNCNCTRGLRGLKQKWANKSWHIPGHHWYSTVWAQPQSSQTTHLSSMWAMNRTCPSCVMKQAQPYLLLPIISMTILDWKPCQHKTWPPSANRLSSSTITSWNIRLYFALLSLLQIESWSWIESNRAER